MPSQALYRKWRSRTFDEVVAQEHVTRTLSNALQSGRIAHAYLFTGPRGTGKTSTARILAKAVNCTGPDGQRPCNQCPTCLAVERRPPAGPDRDRRRLQPRHRRDPRPAREGQLPADRGALQGLRHRRSPHADQRGLQRAAQDAGGAAAARDLHPGHHRAAQDSRRRSSPAASASTSVASRPVPWSSDCVSSLEEEGIEAEDEALEFIARQSTGSLRDAVSLLDQLVSYGGATISLAQVQDVLGLVPRQVVQKLVGCLVSGDIGGGLAVLNEAVSNGADALPLSREIVEYLRGLLLTKMSGDAKLLNVAEDERVVMKAQAEAVPLARLVDWVKAFNQASLEVRLAVNPQLPLELAVVSALTEERARRSGRTGSACPPGARSAAIRCAAD